MDRIKEIINCSDGEAEEIISVFKKATKKDFSYMEAYLSKRPGRFFKVSTGKKEYIIKISTYNTLREIREVKGDEEGKIIYQIIN